MTGINLVIIISGNGSNLQSIIDAIETEKLDVNISAVISNNADAYGLTRATNHCIESIVIDHRHFQSRDAFDRELLYRLNRYRPDFIVLAGFMRILGSDFIQAYTRKILNIHPSLLPNYKGLNTHQRALDNNESEHGVSIHLVTAELDDGPILLQARYPVESGDSVEELQNKGHELEHRMYPAILQWLSTGDLQIREDSIVYKNQAIYQAIEFEQEV